MVKTAPLSPVTISAFCPMTASCSRGHILQTPLTEEKGSGRVRIVIEVACHDDAGRSVPCQQGVDGDSQPASHCHAKGARDPLATHPAGSMEDKHVKGIPVQGKTPHVQDISRGSHVGQGIDTKGVIA